MGIDTQLTLSEETTLAELEAIVQRNRRSFLDAGIALQEIAFRKLYRATYGTFEAYCKARWGISRKIASDYILAAGVVETVTSTLQTPVSHVPKAPPSLTQAREMAVLSLEQQRDLAAKVDFGRATVKDVKERVAEVRTPPASGNHRTKGTGHEHTPAGIIEAVRDILEIIELDPCSTAIANETVQAERFFTEDDGLRQAWRAETVYMNPPQRLTSQFIENLLDVMETGAVQESIALLRDCSDAAWFQRAGGMAGAICLAPGRISIFYFGPNADRFADRFDSIGLTVSTYWIRSAETSVSPDQHPIIEAAKQPNSPVDVEPTPEQTPAVERTYVVDDDGRYQGDDDQVLKGEL